MQQWSVRSRLDSPRSINQRKIFTFTIPTNNWLHFRTVFPIFQRKDVRLIRGRFELYILNIENLINSHMLHVNDSQTGQNQSRVSATKQLGAIRASSKWTFHFLPSKTFMTGIFREIGTSIVRMISLNILQILFRKISVIILQRPLRVTSQLYRFRRSTY